MVKGLLITPLIIELGNTLRWGFLFPFDRSSAHILASGAALLPFASDSLASVAPLTVRNARKQYKCTRKGLLNSHSLGVLCCASSVFCRGSYVSRHNFTALFFDARLKYHIFSGLRWSKRSGNEDCLCLGYKESACDFRKIDQDIGVRAS